MTRAHLEADALYLVGGAGPAGTPVARIARIDPVGAAVAVGRRAIVLGGTNPAPPGLVLATALPA